MAINSGHSYLTLNVMIMCNFLCQAKEYLRTNLQLWMAINNGHSYLTLNVMIMCNFLCQAKDYLHTNLKLWMAINNAVIDATLLP